MDETNKINKDDIVDYNGGLAHNSKAEGIPMYASMNQGAHWDLSANL